MLFNYHLGDVSQHLINEDRAQIRQKNSNLPQMERLRNNFSPLLVAVASITIVRVKPHPTMAKGGRWVQALSP